jgi:hypothetical protein
MADLPEGTQLVYANWVRLGSTPFDISIDIGYQPEPGPPDSYPLRVVMSWEHAQAFARLLDRTIESYKEQAGELREFEEVPPNDDQAD